MNRFITEELQRIKLLSNYDNSKTLSEQQISKRERQLNNYYTKNSSNVKQIQTKLQELGLDIGASNPDGILGKSTLASILSFLNAPKDFKPKGDNQPADGDNQPTDSTNQPATGTNQPATGTNQTVAVANQPDNETLPNAKAKDVRRVDAQNGV
jgi:hypothetical protein